LDKAYEDRLDETIDEHYWSVVATRWRNEQNQVLSNCTFDGVTLYPIYRKPFNLIVEGIKTQRKYPLLDEICNSLLTSSIQLLANQLMQVVAD
jgi:hypothetical protein